MGKKKKMLNFFHEHCCIISFGFDVFSLNLNVLKGV